MRKPLFISLFLLLGISAAAQLTKADYDRADTIRNLNKLVLYDDVDINWIDSTSSFWYRVNTPRGTEYFFIDAANPVKKPAFDHEKLCAAINKACKKELKPYEMNLNRLSFSDDMKSVEFIMDSKKWKCNLKKYSIEELERVPERNWDRGGYWGESPDLLANKPVASPDGKWSAYIKDYNVFVKENGKEKEYQLSFDGSPGDLYSSYISWSPDSKKLATNQVRPAEKRFFYLIESSPKDQLQPILHKREYAKAGDALPISKPRLFNIDQMKQLEFDTSPFENQFYMGSVEWYDDSRGFTFEFNQRGHQVYQVVQVDANSGEVKILIDEQSKTFIDYSGKKIRYDVNDGKEIIWASERDGWNHLFLYDGKSGALKNQITKGNWVVRKLENVDEKSRTILFQASGLTDGEDPYNIHYCKVNFDGSGFIDLTPENANHRASFSKDYAFFTDKYSRVDLPPVTVLRNGKDGKVVKELEKADISALLDAGYNVPEPFVTKGRDGTTDIWGLIYRPLNFDASKQYPIIESIYAGPHGSFVPKDFMSIPYYAKLAEYGFIIVQIDGMGTSNRSKAFHDVCWKNLKDAGFPDRILWIQAAAEKYPYMDTTRVGIYGTSAGGQSSTAALLFHPEFYDVAVSACGCHDNRMDKIWWNEAWMGYPVGEEYADNSNVTHAGNLKGNLMLILGEMDDNVDPSSTMQLVDALVKADKEFELVILPGLNHTSGGAYGDRKRNDFFIKHLLDVDAPAWNKE